jgi:tellurite resistance protein
MSDTSLLAAAARAYAIVCFSDGRLTPVEARLFASFAGNDETLRSATAGDIEAAWSLAAAEVEASADDRASLEAIAACATAPKARAAVMRAAQAATVADDRLELQENAAVRRIAQALKLDPETY